MTRLIFNELSLCKLAPNKEIARTQLRELINVCTSVIKKGFSKELRTHEDFLFRQVSQDYTIKHWLNDPEVEKEVKLRFKGLIAKVPFINMEVEKEIYDATLTHEFSFNGISVKGLGIAYLMGGLGVSLNREEHWNNSKIILRTTYYDAEIDDLLSEDVTVNHASTLANLRDHESWFLNDRMTDIVNASELWKNREKLFPKLEFCDNVYDWLKKCDYGNPLFRQIINRLVELNNYFDSWNEGPFNPEALPSKCSPESKATLEQFEKEHTFTSPDGEKNLYSWHVRVTPGAWRIFFLVNEQNKKGRIGYIGPKLDTVRCH